MDNETIPTIWEAPCETCGAWVLTDQYTAAPYFDAPCGVCGGEADSRRWRVSDEPHPALYQ